MTHSTRKGGFLWGAMVASLQDRYSCCNTVMDAVARPGAFAANFTPDVLNRFRDLCKRQGKQYTKVLQLLAELYLETDGAVLDGRVSVGEPADPDKKKRQVQVESLQNKLLEDLLKRVEVLEKETEKQKVKTEYGMDKMMNSIAAIKSGLIEPESKQSKK